METEYVHNLLLRLCNQPRTFEYLSKYMKGLDPIQVSHALAVLEKDKKLSKDRDYWVLNESVKALTLDIVKPDQQLYLKKYMGHYDFLKMPHPLDFEWRNTTRSLNYLTELVTTTNQVNDAVLLMGMPTLYANIANKDIPQNVTLIEKNEPIVNALRRFSNHKSKVIPIDIFTARPQDIGKYYSVFMDPPWYTEHFKQFIWLAAQSIRVGGFLVISIPPINTRPGIDKERLEWFSFCQQQGLCIENLFSEKLEYAMPFFEFNAYRAAGIKNILPFWRKGDVAIFRKIAKLDTVRPPLVLKKNDWIEREIDTVRIRVNPQIHSKNPNDLLQIESIVQNDILPTVSTRDPRKELANIWTSGNRIFSASNPTKFLRFLNNQNQGSTDQEILICKEFLSLITELEKQEYNDYLDWLYYEMERQDN